MCDDDKVFSGDTLGSWVAGLCWERFWRQNPDADPELSSSAGCSRGNHPPWMPLLPSTGAKNSEDTEKPRSTVTKAANLFTRPKTGTRRHRSGRMFPHVMLIRCQCCILILIIKKCSLCLCSLECWCIQQQSSGGLWRPWQFHFLSQGWTAENTAAHRGQCSCWQAGFSRCFAEVQEGL